MDENRFSPTESRGGSATRAVIGLAGLAVAIWGLAGAPDIADSNVLRWGAIGVAVLIGLVLIVVGGLSGRKP